MCKPCFRDPGQFIEGSSFHYLEKDFLVLCPFGKALAKDLTVAENGTFGGILLTMIDSVGCYQKGRAEMQS